MIQTGLDAFTISEIFRGHLNFVFMREQNKHQIWTTHDRSPAKLVPLIK